MDLFLREAFDRIGAEDALAKIDVDLHRFCSGLLLILGGDLFEGHG